MKNNMRLNNSTIKSGLVSEKEYEKIVNPKKLIKPYLII